MSSVDVLLQSFTQIFAGSSTEVIQNAQKKLLQLQKDIHFLTNCLTILIQPQIQYQVKKMIAIYFRKYSKRVVKQKNPSKTVGIVHFLLSILQNNNIAYDLKPEIKLALEQILNMQSNRGIKIQLARKLISELQQSVKQPDQNINFTYLIFCGQALTGSYNYSDQTKDFIKGSFMEFVLLNIRLINMTQRYSLENKQALFLIYKLLKEYSMILKFFFKRLGVLDIEATKLLYLQELEQCLTSGIAINLKENSLPSSLFILIPDEIQMSKAINIAKANYIGTLTAFINMIQYFIKHANLLNSNPLYVKMPQLLQYFISSASSFLGTAAFQQLPPKSGLFESIDNLFHCLIVCLRLNDLYTVFSKHKNQLIDKIILPCLSLTPREATSFYEDPAQFILFSLQVVERDLKSTAAFMSVNKEEANQDDEIKQYETLKTYAGDFLSSLCQFQDGTLTHIFEHAFGVIQNKIAGTYSKSTMFLVIACLKSHLRQRKDLKVKIAQLFMLLLNALPLPVVDQNNKKDQDIEYAYLLLSISKLYLYLKELYPQIVNISFKAGYAVLQSPTTSQVHKTFALDLFNEIIKYDDGDKYVFDIVGIFNHLILNSTEISIPLLDSYFDLIKYCGDVLRVKPGSLLQGLKYICQHIEKQVQLNNPNQLIINKCWNVIRLVGQGKDFMPDLIPQLEQLILPFVPYIDGVRNLDFEEDILLLITSFVDKGKRVTPNQQKMFEIIPKIFYGQYFCRFGQAFHTIQLFIYYGSQVLRGSIAAIEAIVQMSLTSISQTEYKKKPIGEIQNCEGVLILQSLAVKCGDLFTGQIWGSIVKTIMNKLGSNITHAFLTSNLYGLLALCLVYAHNFWSVEQSEVIMTRVLTSVTNFANVEYSPKVLITAFTEMLLRFDVPFISRRYVQIMDQTVTLLEMTVNKKSTLFGTDADNQDEEAEYSNSLILLKNDMKAMDEFKFFREKYEQLKQMNRQLLLNTVAQFPQTKRKFLTNILAVEKVSNIPRRIIKIER